MVKTSCCSELVCLIDVNYVYKLVLTVSDHEIASWNFEMFCYYVSAYILFESILTTIAVWMSGLTNLWYHQKCFGCDNACHWSWITYSGTHMSHCHEWTCLDLEWSGCWGFLMIRYICMLTNIIVINIFIIYCRYISPDLHYHTRIFISSYLWSVLWFHCF